MCSFQRPVLGLSVFSPSTSLIARIFTPHRILIVIGGLRGQDSRNVNSEDTSDVKGVAPQQLLEQARQGDVEAFATLFEAMRAKTFAVACRLVGPSEAEDVVMDSYLKAWQALPRFRGAARLDTWLYRIVNNVALDRIRKRKRLRELPLTGDDEGQREVALPDPDAPAPGERMQRQEVRTEVRHALRQLPDVHRIALELRFVDDLSYAQIAAATGVSIGTVMSRLFNAKRKLRTVLDTPS